MSQEMEYPTLLSSRHHVSRRTNVLLLNLDEDCIKSATTIEVAKKEATVQHDLVKPSVSRRAPLPPPDTPPPDLSPGAREAWGNQVLGVETTKAGKSQTMNSSGARLPIVDPDDVDRVMEMFIGFWQDCGFLRRTNEEATRAEEEAWGRQLFASPSIVALIKTFQTPAERANLACVLGDATTKAGKSKTLNASGA